MILLNCNAVAKSLLPPIFLSEIDQFRGYYMQFFNALTFLKLMFIGVYSLYNVDGLMCKAEIETQL